MKVFLFLLAFALPLLIYTVIGKYLINIPYRNFRIILGLIFLFLSGFFVKNQRFLLAFFFLLLSLTLTTKEELFFEVGR